MTPDQFEPKNLRPETRILSPEVPDTQKDTNQLSQRLLVNLENNQVDDPDELRIAVEEINDDPYNPVNNND